MYPAGKALSDEKALKLLRKAEELLNDVYETQEEKGFFEKIKSKHISSNLFSVFIYCCTYVFDNKPIRVEKYWFCSIRGQYAFYYYDDTKTEDGSDSAILVDVYKNYLLGLFDCDEYLYEKIESYYEDYIDSIINGVSQ